MILYCSTLLQLNSTLGPTQKRRTFWFYGYNIWKTCIIPKKINEYYTGQVILKEVQWFISKEYFQFIDFGIYSKQAITHLLRVTMKTSVFIYAIKNNHICGNLSLCLVGT